MPSIKVFRRDPETRGAIETSRVVVLRRYRPDAEGFEWRVGNDYYQPLPANNMEEAVYEALKLASAEGWREDTMKGKSR